ncbi:MAG TPA: hypothetical protein O0X27_01255 [Methanocorpusculum sp.]|nr:hypothetical protein [Methanocorpusculum sp.]
MSAADQSEVLRALQKATGRVENVLRYIIPKSGITMAYAMEDAVDQKKVAVFSNGSIGFGIDEPVSRLILTARRFNPEVRSVGTIRLNDDIRETVTEAFRDVAAYDAAAYPKGISTMDWGLNFICRNRNSRGDKTGDGEEGVPIAVFAENTAEYGGIIYIFGETPDDVANRILIISERLTL